MEHSLMDLRPLGHCFESSQTAHLKLLKVARYKSTRWCHEMSWCIWISGWLCSGFR